MVSFSSVLSPIVSLLNSLIGPLLGIVGALGMLYCISLGIKFAKAEEPQDREKAKESLKGAIIGFVLIFIMMVGLRLLMPVMTNWAQGQTGIAINTGISAPAATNTTPATTPATGGDGAGGADG